MLNAKFEKQRWLFYPSWIVLNIIAVLLAWYISWAIMAQITAVVGGMIMIRGQSRITEDAIFVYILLPTIGLLAGMFQFMLIRRYLPRMGWWIAVTFLGWLMPFVIGFLGTVIFTPNNDTFSIMLGLLVIGVFIALPQWWLLRRRVQYANWWLVANGFGWMMIGLLNNFTTEPFPVLFAVALTPSITTGIAWWLFLDWLPKRPLKNSISNI